MSESPPRSTIPIARFDGRQVLPLRAEIDTLADCLDHGRALYVRCGCNPRIVEVFPERLLALPNPPGESTRLSELRPWLTCKKCWRRERLTVRAGEEWRGGLIPRKPQPVKQFIRHAPTPTLGGPREPFTPAPGGPKGRKRVFKAR
ncbi:hypothetical protein [Parvibaculum sp.]|uniref:hypothetical protein n=1 Tax=Parvibaculum sp. TaxID=2024848 RepID=UPI001B21324C|nr:hypothetical protein [Parvibaculum sp.]MBO6679153.1 hypothetical protein [Parvibaculum sp.]MBO6685660.1 hypothetical protein [Parvibaculum sp.]MBO6904158.1 hypothetical protein [Parvibaculum sp.]